MSKEVVQVGDPRVDMRHSYEAFTERPFYIEVNRTTVSGTEKFDLVLDIATGTGGIINEIMNLKLESYNGYGIFVGVDKDKKAIEEARKKFKSKDVASSLTYPYVSFYFVEGSAEETGEKDNDYELVTFCNAIHLTDVPKSLAEAYRVLMPGGTFIANSAFVDGVGYPDKDAFDLWSSLGRGAIRKVIRAGHRPTESPKNYFKYTRADYEEMVKSAGFTDVEISEIQVLMDLDDVLAICHYDEFASGALPGVPLEVAHKALAESAIEIFKKLKEEGGPEAFPRGWMLLKALKP